MILSACSKGPSNTENVGVGRDFMTREAMTPISSSRVHSGVGTSSKRIGQHWSQEQLSLRLGGLFRDGLIDKMIKVAGTSNGRVLSRVNSRRWTRRRIVEQLIIKFSFSRFTGSIRGGRADGDGFVRYAVRSITSQTQTEATVYKLSSSMTTRRRNK